MNNNEKLQGQLRHLLSSIGGILLMFGIAKGNEGLISQAVEIGVSASGFFIMLIAFVKSWKSKKKDEQTAEFIDQVVEKALLKIEEGREA